MSIPVVTRPICKDCKYFYPNYNYHARDLRLEYKNANHSKILKP